MTELGKNPVARDLLMACIGLNTIDHCTGLLDTVYQHVSGLADDASELSFASYQTTLLQKVSHILTWS